MTVPVPTPPSSPMPLARITVGPAGLTAQCLACGVYLEQRAGTDTRAAVRAFVGRHPLSRHARHSDVLPDGWRVRLVGALSQ